MYQRVLMSLTITVAFSLAVFVQATAAKPVSAHLPVIAGPIVQSHPLVSEKVAGLDLVVQSRKPLPSEKIKGLQLQSTSTQTGVAATGNGFDWGDAGIGSGFVFGTVLLGAGLVMTVRRQDFPIAH